MIPGALPQRAPAANPNAPPKNADDRKASELWSKFTQLPRPVSEPHVFRAKGQEVGTLVFQVLTAAEAEYTVIAAHAAAVEKLGEGAKGSVAFEELYHELKAINLVSAAARQPPTPGSKVTFPTFLSAADVRENLTEDEIAVLLMTYGTFRRETGPIVSQLDDEECHAWYEVLGRGASRAPLASCSGEALTDLVMYLVSKLKAASSTATSSPGPQPDASSSPTSSGESPEPEPAPT